MPAFCTGRVTSRSSVLRPAVAALAAGARGVSGTLIGDCLARLAFAFRASPDTRPLRVGLDIDGVIASTAWERPPWTEPDGWEASAVLDADALAAVVAHVDAARWEAYAITARPAGPGRSVQQQTRRWLHAHRAGALSVVLDPGNRAAIASALALDWLVDDYLESCTATALETGARAIWIAPRPAAAALRQAEASGCLHASGLAAAVALIERS